MRRVKLLVNFVVLLVKLVFVRGFLACVVVSAKLTSELSNNNEETDDATSENPELHAK